VGGHRAGRDVLGKGIGGGFPLGAILAKEHVAEHLKPGTHGTTFGGNPLACAAGNAVLDVVLAPGFLDGVDRVARHLWRGMLALADRRPEVVEGVQGAGSWSASSCGRRCPTPTCRRRRWPKGC
jgi:acetylornithine/succinyldiaminopimelate/putrescine aminotransferase